MKRLARSVIDILAGNISIKFLGFLFTPLLVRALTKSQYGQFVGILVVLELIQVLSNVGLFQSMKKHTAATADTERKSVFIAGLALAVAYSAVAVIVVYGLTTYSPFDLFTGTTIAYAAIAVIVFRNPLEVVRGYLYGLKQERAAESLRLFRKGIYTLLGLGAAYTGLGLVGIFTGYAISFFLAAVVGLGLGYRAGWITTAALPNRAQFNRVARYGAVSILGYISAFLLYKTDILLIQYFIGDSATAGYQAATFSSELIWIVPGAIQGALLQDVAAKWSNDDIDSVSKTLHTSIKYGVGAIILFGGGLFALTDDFLLIYFGSEYTESTFALRALLIGTAVYGVNRLYIPVLQAVGKLRQQQATNVAALGLNIVANLILIPRFGVIGAVVGTTISYVSIIFGSILILRQTPIEGPGTKLWIRLGALTVGFVTLYIVPVSVVSLSPVLSLLVFPPIGGLVFFVLAHSLGLLNGQYVLASLIDQVSTRFHRMYR